MKRYFSTGIGEQVYVLHPCLVTGSCDLYILRSEKMLVSIGCYFPAMLTLGYQPKKMFRVVT